MDISFVRTQGERDRVYVKRSNGTEVSWAFPGFGNYVPHDLVHLVVETAFGLKDGFWGRVDAGVDVARINSDANRKGGADKYAAFGVNQVDLVIAEILAGTRWADASVPDQELLDGIIRACPRLAPVPAERISEIRWTLDRLCARWRRLLPKGTLHARFDRLNPEESFHSLQPDYPNNPGGTVL